MNRRNRLAASLAGILLGVLGAGACSGAGDPPAAGGDAAAPAARATTTAPTTGQRATTTTAEPAAPTTAAAPAAAVHYRFPVAGCQARYGRSHHDYPAADIFADRGCAFVAPVAGRVDEVTRSDTWSPATNRGADRGGRSVSLVGVDGVRYYGSHLEAVDQGVVPGLMVRAGQPLGRVGNSGSARGIATHLHFGISWPTRPGIWWVRRGIVQPARYLDAWRAGDDLSPAGAVRAARAVAGREVPACRSYC